MTILLESVKTQAKSLEFQKKHLKSKKITWIQKITKKNPNLIKTDLIRFGFLDSFDIFDIFLNSSDSFLISKDCFGTIVEFQPIIFFECGFCFAES